ncbi:MAG: ribonuclease J [Bacilli bacterium]
MKDIIKICALGGLDEAGRDCYVIEINDDIFVLDYGLLYADKSIPGVDYLIPNVDYLIENKKKIKAYILTHGHDENMGGIKYLYNKAPAPIYTTFATKEIIVGQMKNLGMKADKYDFHIIEPSSTHQIAGRKVVFFQTSHNAAYSFGVAINTNQGNIVYTGDFIVDYTVSDKAFYFDLKQLSLLAEEETLLLMSESKAASSDGYCAPKHRLFPKALKYFTNEDKRIFICTFWQNFYRIIEIFKLCKAGNKKIYPYDDYTRSIVNKIIECDKDKVVPITTDDIVSPQDLLRIRQQDIVILILGKEKEMYKDLIKLANHTNEDKRIVLGEEDIFILSAIAIPYLETEATKAGDSLYRTGCEVVWIKKKNLQSMHAHQDDLKLMLSILRPKYYLPVRGDYGGLMANAKLALSMGIGLNHFNVFVLDNGMQLCFDENNNVHIYSNEEAKIPISPILVDGLGISKIGNELIEDRNKLSVDGVVVIAASISSSKKEIIAGPDCQMRGFVFVKEAEPLLKSVSQIFVDEINAVLSTGSLNFDKALLAIKERSRKFIKRENGRDPMILPIVMYVD